MFMTHNHYIIKIVIEWTSNNVNNSACFLTVNFSWKG